MITISELMTTNPYTLNATASVSEAWKIMTEKHIRHIPVTDKSNQLLGLVTQRDVLAATEPASLQGSNGVSGDIESATCLSDIMIRDVTVLHQKESLRQAAVYMQSHKYGCMPVVSDDGLIGIITDSDFVAIAINLMEQIEVQEDHAEFEDDIDDVELPKSFDDV